MLHSRVAQRRRFRKGLLPESKKPWTRRRGARRPFRRLAATLATAGLALGLAAGPSSAFEPPTEQALEAGDRGFTLRPGVVVDPARSAVYVAREGSVTAVDPRTGEQLWSSTAAELPVGLYGDRLVALAEPEGLDRGEVLFLSVTDGRAEAAIDLDLPPGVGAFVEDRPHQRFTAATRVVDGVPYLHWSWHGRELRGRPSLDESGRAVTRSSGAFLLDPVARRATEAPDAGPSPGPPSFVPDLSPEESLDGFTGRQFRSKDDRHRLVSRRIEGASRPRHRWTVVDLQGRRLGELDRPTSYSPFFVVGPLLVHEAPPTWRSTEGGVEARPLSLRAVDLDTGKEAWSIEVRDTAYRGPQPP